MKAKTNNKLTGAALALAAAALAGCNTNGDTAGGSASASTSTDMVHCYNVNICKGHNDCKTADNACKGHATCKGTGFVAMPSKSCGDIGGKVQDQWTGSVATADLSKCYGVNVCKGHNDCKTAENACKGHASCKGTGFVKMHASACSDVGGQAKS